MQPPLALYARWKKARFFSSLCKKTDVILDVGSGSGWWERFLRSHGFTHITSLDRTPSATIQGDIGQWKELGLHPASFDVVTAFEVIEHVDCLNDIRELLRSGGLLMLTTPVPSRDWVLWILEHLGISQWRTSAHTHLTDVSTIPGFTTLSYRRIAGLAQWGVYQKAAA